jgi:rhamnose transport system permease protein
VYTGALLAEGRIGKDSLQAGRLGTIEVRGTQVVLGAPFIFNKGNIDGYDF